MKNLIPVAAVICFAIAMSCNKTTQGPPGVIVTDPYINIYAGTYKGLYNASNNGADSGGVFKIDTSYDYSLKIEDAGNHNITINHGPINITNIPVNSSGTFSFEDYNHNIIGQFSGDSLHLSSDALNGYYDTIYYVGSWFVIQKLSFDGKKQL